MEKGFEKLNFEQKGSKFKLKRGLGLPKLFKSKKFKIVFLVFLVIFILAGSLGAYTGFRAMQVYKQAKILNVQGHVALAAAKSQNIEVAKTELAKTQQELNTLKQKYSGLSYLKFFPILNGYYNDGNRVFNAAGHGIDAAIIATDSLIPYADVLGLKGGGSFSQGSAEDRIRIAVKTMGKVVPKIDDIDQKMQLAKKEIDGIDPDRYPQIGKLKQIKPQIIAVQSLIDEGVLAVEQGKPLIKVIPELLGEKEEKKYLILFQNDNEQRATGGFLTFYALFRVEQGVIKVDSASDIYDLDDSIASHPAAPEIITKYLPKVSKWYIRDTNLSPDFQVSMDDFLAQYNKSSRKQDIDGIIAIDTDFLVNLLKILGEVQAGGLTFKPDMDERCNCPQAVYVLNDNITKPVGFVKENRKSLLGELLLATMQKALQSSPSQYWGPLFQQALKDAQAKHVLFYLENEEAQKGLDGLNWTGRIKDFEGDYVHINDANFGGAKSNLYVTQSVAVDYVINDKGEIKKTVKITYKNPQPHSDCNLERGGLCLNAILRNFQRVYVPEGTTLDSSKGSEVKIETKKELGKTYFESFFTVKPLGKSEITYVYTLPFLLGDKSDLPVLIQKQPGTSDVPYEISVNGEVTETFNLVSDKQLMLRLR